MTRKEVCKATGLSIKTLRLYEEKGLITLEKEYRNGREYREYTPELVRQLQCIAMLRRAMFTMDEIRTMQQHPEQIPEIFHGYQAWLQSQEQQFRKLRQAAGQVAEGSLGSMEDLMSGLQTAAAELPLPAMDIKPNFKRLDEMEEEPRHIIRQVNFNEVVPDAKVFRQMNLVMDRDESNNVGLAFGQYNALREGTPEETGPVRRQPPQSPRWKRILEGLLSALFLAFLVLAFFLYSWALFWVGMGLLAVRVGLSAVPLLLAQHRWLGRTQQEDYRRQQSDTPFSDYQAERKRWKKPLILGSIGAVVLLVGTLVLCRVQYTQTHPAADYRIRFAGSLIIGDKSIEAMENTLTPLIGDLDGDGETLLAVDYMDVQPGFSAQQPGDNEGRVENLQTELQDGDYQIILIVDRKSNMYNVFDDFSFRTSCRVLPEDLADPKDPYKVDLSGIQALKAGNLEELTVYGGIANTATDEEYEFAVELLREMLAQ
jgi:DNA-binding transcriptional MerR regulator